MIFYTLHIFLLAYSILFQCIAFVDCKKVDKIHAKSIEANQFEGPSLNFLGNEIANVQITNATIGHLHHLTVHSIEVQSEHSDRAGGIRMATIDYRGSLSTIPHVKWDESNQALEVPRLSSPSKTIYVDSDIDLKSNVLRNFRMEENATMRSVIFEGGIIRDSKLANVTFQNLTLGSVTVDALAITSTQNNIGNGAFLIASNGGIVKSSDAIQEENDSIIIKSKVIFKQPVDFGDVDASNVHITSGSILGDEFDIKGRNVAAEAFTILPYQKSKRHFMDALAIVDTDGVLRSANLTLEDGWIENAKFAGDIHFRADQRQGRIVDAAIEGGTMKGVEELSVVGHVKFQSGLSVQEDTYIDGSLTVGGSVLGSGPYVDVSDARLKTNINEISSNDIMDRMRLLQAVSYDLDEDAFPTRKRAMENSNEHQQIGFIAQDVQKLFPELVSERPDGYLGIQYSRFVPLVIEAMKDIDDRIRQMEEENTALRNMVLDLLKEKD